MARFKKRLEGTALEFSDVEALALGLEENREYDLIPVKKGVWVLGEHEVSEPEVSTTPNSAQHAKTLAPKVHAPPFEETINPSPKKNESGTPAIAPHTPLDNRIYQLLADRKIMKNLVVGNFEQQLNEAEQKRFKELLRLGLVEPFKSSEKYIKAIYRIARKKPLATGAPAPKASEKPDAPEKPIEEYSLEVDGLLVVKNELRAQKLSAELRPQIEDKSVRGLRSFDGNFYIVTGALYDKHASNVQKLVRENPNIALPALAQKAGVSPLLTRIICEFLKEEGAIIERRKESYREV